MSKSPENGTSADVQSSSPLAADNKQESYLTCNNTHTEVPVGSLNAQDTFVKNQPDELQTESQMISKKEVAETEDVCTSADQNVERGDNDNVSERQLDMTENQEETGDGIVTNMSVHVRSGIHVADQMSVACGDGEGSEHVSQNEWAVKSETDVKVSSPISQYSSDAAATGIVTSFSEHAFSINGSQNYFFCLE